MNRSLSTIAGFGLVAAIFLAILSMFYLKQIPNREDIDRLQADLRIEHDPILDAAVPLDIELVMPKEEGDPLGVRIACAFRSPLRKRPDAVERLLVQIGEAALEHPNWRGRVAFAEVVHTPEPRRARTVRLGRARADLGDERSKG